MKKLITAIQILLFSMLMVTESQAQNVGIATDSPDAPFHVSSSGQVITPGGLMLLGNRSELHLELDFNRVQSAFGLEGLPTVLFMQPEGGNVKFGEKVAIGTNSFSAGLNVDGGPDVSETGKGDVIIGDKDNFHVRYDGNEILARSGDNPATLYLQYWSGDLSLAYDDDGKVGIGTASPQAKVHITDATDLNLADGGHLILGSTTGTNLAFDNNEIMARNNGATSPMYLQGNGGDILMIPNEQGSVGIGITSNAFLPDGYLLAVDGKIISEEIRVELSSDWPDYVFEPEYKLTSLESLEELIKEKGHLPGIPSADIMESNGLDLGDMQKRMVEKIEELTLYMIEANKQIKALEQKMNILEGKD